MKLQNKRGFTLIELLVVITIIGILATGWVTVYTQQISKANDTARINSTTTVAWAIEIFNTDYQFYPPATSNLINIMSGSISDSGSFRDPKNGSKACYGTTVLVTDKECWMSYSLMPDDNGFSSWAFKLYTLMESKSNVTWNWKAAIDWWTFAWAYEKYNWVWASNKSTWVFIKIN